MYLLVLAFCAVISSCRKEIKLITLDDFLGDCSGHLVEKNDLNHFLYLGAEVFDKVNAKCPGLLTPQIAVSDFFIHDSVKTTIALRGSYMSIEELIDRLDPSLIRELEIMYGVSDPGNSMLNRILVYRNSAFIEFVSHGSVHGFTIELRGKNVASIGVAFVIVS